MTLRRNNQKNGNIPVSHLGLAVESSPCVIDLKDRGSFVERQDVVNGIGEANVENC